MTKEELIKRLSEIEDALIKIERPVENRVYLCCESENSLRVNKFLFEELKLRFVIATGIDSEDCFEILYHYAYDKLGFVVNVKAFIRDRKNPSIDSITPVIAGAEWIEREMHDLLGIDFKGHPRLERLILADDWPEGVYPLRKEVQK